MPEKANSFFSWQTSEDDFHTWYLYLVDPATFLASNYVSGEVWDMLNILQIYIHQMLLSKAVTVIRTYTDGSGCQPEHQDSGLAQGHFNMQTRGIIPATFWIEEAGSTPEPQPLYIVPL